MNRVHCQNMIGRKKHLMTVLKISTYRYMNCLLVLPIFLYLRMIELNSYGVGTP